MIKAYVSLILITLGSLFAHALLSDEMTGLFEILSSLALPGEDIKIWVLFISFSVVDILQGVLLQRRLGGYASFSGMDAKIVPLLEELFYKFSLGASFLYFFEGELVYILLLYAVSNSIFANTHWRNGIAVVQIAFFTSIAYTLFMFEVGVLAIIVQHYLYNAALVVFDD